MVKQLLFSTLIFAGVSAHAQDSLKVSIYPKYDRVGKFHRFLFGENYRKEYADSTKVPVIRLSQIKGGLTPIKRGGGNQTHSLRMEDKQGKEWVLRSVEKYPEVLLPLELQATFAKDIVKDNMSAQHPFSALVVPVFADAIGIPHSNPMIGWVLPDAALGEFAPVFENSLCLLEEREPEGDTDNTDKMLRKLNDNHNNSVDATLMLKAKALDYLLGDWDRHEDQWRWVPEKTAQGTRYVVVPRDRDMVYYLSQGLIPRFAQVSWLLPMIQGYERNVQNINWFFWEGRSMYGRILGTIGEEEWDRIIQDFSVAMTDELFEHALKKLPEPSYSLRHDQLLAQLKERRKSLAETMKTYYHFMNRIVDVQGSNKNELVQISDHGAAGLTVNLKKLDKNGNAGETLFNRNYDPSVTKEIRLYVRDGNDSVLLHNKNSNIRIRMVNGEGKKHYDIVEARRKVPFYGMEEGITYSGASSRLIKHLANDTNNTHYVPTDLYSRNMTLLNAGFNADDGLSMGLSYKIMSPGFRKLPFGNIHSFSFLHAFKTKAFSFNYSSEWFHALGKADIVLQASAFAPENSQNFFGLGNETPYVKTGDYVVYYRARFSLYDFDPALRWRDHKNTWTAGPTFQYYRFNREDNNDRFIGNSDQLHSPDSATISQDKWYTGLKVGFIRNTRNNEVLPSSGNLIDAKLRFYTGLNAAAASSLQLLASYTFYQKIGNSKRFVLANRTGGGLTFGNQAFYQSNYIGGQGNLLGFRSFRFGGQHSLYNNLELRTKLANVGGYILPGQFGITAFFDTGRVWTKQDESNVWHYSYGGGLYYAPAILTVVQAQLAHSKEGYYPYITMKFRY